MYERGSEGHLHASHGLQLRGAERDNRVLHPVEPGVTYQKGRYTATFTRPIAVRRNRITTYGRNTPGDAAFADYTCILTLSMKL